MRFSELSEQARRRAYGEYVAAMNDEWNREDVLLIEDTARRLIGKDWNLTRAGRLFNAEP